MFPFSWIKFYVQTIGGEVSIEGEDYLNKQSQVLLEVIEFTILFD